MSDRGFPFRMPVAIACAVACLTTIGLHGEDWPQWRGVNRDASAIGPRATPAVDAS